MLKRNYFICIAAFLLAFIFLKIVDPNNLGFSSDSMAYLEGARNIKAGKGYVYDNGNLINHWPPLYSTCIALTSILLKVNLIYAAKYLHAILIFGIIILLDKIFKDLKLTRYLSLLVILLFFLSAASKVFLWHLSEGLFTFFILYSYYLFTQWIKYESKKALISAGIISGLLFLTRFAGLGFIGVYCLFIIFRNDHLSKKINVFLLYLTPLIIVLLPWLIYSQTMGSNLQDRSFDIHPITLDKLENFISVIKNWFFGTYITVKLAPVFGLFILYRIFRVRKEIPKLITQHLRDQKLPVMSAIASIVFYSLFIFISASFFDHGIPFDNRMFYPIFPFLMILIATILQFLYDAKFNLTLYSLGLFLILGFTTSGFPVYKAYYEFGLGHTQQKWRNSSIIKHISNEENVVYYSNATEILKLNTDQTGKKLPNKSRPEELMKIKAEVENGDVQILIIKPLFWPAYLVSEAQILEEFQGFTFSYFEDGYLIKAPSKS